MSTTTFNPFRRRKKGPAKTFSHSDTCRMLAADPGVQIQWSEIETGHWRAVCQCGSEDVHEELADRRVRLNPLDPATARHLGQCEYVAETDPAVLKFVLKVKPGLGEGYDWVECGPCDAGWQVAHYAESVG